MNPWLNKKPNHGQPLVHATGVTLLPLLLLLACPSSSNAFPFMRGGSASKGDEGNERQLQSVKWWYSADPSLPGGGQCVESSSYPSNWPTDFPKLLYTSKDQCCNNHKDVSCLLEVPGSPTLKPTLPPLPTLTEKPTKSPTPKVSKWYPDGRNCVEGTGYPDWMAAGLNSYMYLFGSRDDCCQVHPCASSKPAKWWPQVDEVLMIAVCKLDNTYPDSYLKNSGLLFDTEEECCVDFCSSGNATTTTTTVATTTTPATTKATTTTTTTTSDMVTFSIQILPVKWWYSTNPSLPGGGECVQSGSYPSNWPVDFPKFLYDSKDGCCANHRDVSCLLQVPSTSKPTVPQLPLSTTEPTSSPTPKVSKWYYDGKDCVEGTGYPDWMAAGLNSYMYLFVSRDDCCQVNTCSSTKPAKWWPQVDKELMRMVCTFDNAYPDEFMKHGDILFDTEKECCANFCVDGDATTSTTTSTGATTTVNVMATLSNQINDQTSSTPTYNPTLYPDDDGPIQPKYPMFSGPCTSSSQCQAGLVCDIPSKKCICNIETNEGCSAGARCTIPPDLFCPTSGCIPSCHCDPTNDVGGTNGCKAGQVCREPCGMADSGPMCFDDDLKRDCAQRGSNYVCKVNREGVIGGGCVEQRPDDIIPNLGEAGCSKDMCLDPEGQCKPTHMCFMDPCDIQSCDEGYVCKSNYCGGCTAQCVPDGLEQQSATLPASECPRGECHNPDGKCEAEMSCMVDPCNGNECEFGQICQTNMCGGCHAICADDPMYVHPDNVPTPQTTTGPKAGKSTSTTSTASTSTSVPLTSTTSSTEPAKTTTDPQTTETDSSTTAPGSNCPEAKWHISTVVGAKNTCTNDDVYPTTWDNMPGYLFGSPKQCCEKFFGEDCIVIDDCDTTQTSSTSITEAPGSTCPDAKWHISTLAGGVNTCTNDDVYPTAWDSISGYLFASAKECCEKFFGEGCIVNDACSTTDAPDDTTSGSGSDCPELKWHISTLAGGKNTCTNDKVFPSAWNTIQGYLFGSAKECCDRFFPENCIVKDHCECHQNWHMSTVPGEVQTCTNDIDYPSSWNSEPEIFVFSSAQDCCTTLFKDADCFKRDACKACIDTWHVNPDSPASSCSNSIDVPAFWPDFMKGYETGEACCQNYFKGSPCDIVDKCTKTETATTEAPKLTTTTDVPGKTTTAAPETTTTVPETTTPDVITDPPEPTTTMTATTPETTTDATTVAPGSTTDSPKTTTASATTTSFSARTPNNFVDITRGFDSFDDLDNTNPLPWIFGDPDQWIRDTEHKLAGPGALRNVQPIGPGASSDLALKVRLPSYSLVRCYAFIDVGMPHESFIMSVDGAVRYSAYSPKTEWVQVATGLEAGERTITFTVKNASSEPPPKRTTGSGFVWLDICEIVPLQ
ncbi:hypothetical protein HJC23_002864 [Cyclotella cryptica]|uniref:Uncharacterized protein n=1 Tax=Cyclotella cryptica TaxID=29204 RepID=A0ABD3PJA8_9STRA|eukprot:CCRYP_013800-RA/>CCRYP_013800-RA protein AED:0.00 eAED:0.00 QI:352/1/1/1/1/1/2/283/1394